MHSYAFILLLAFLAFWGGHSASVNITDSFLAVTFFIASAAFGFSSFIYLIKKKTDTHTIAWSTLFLLIFLGWLVFGYRYGLDGEQSLSMAVKYLAGMILAVGFSIYARETKYLNTALWTFLVIGGLYGSLCLLVIYENIWWNVFVDNGIASLFSNPNFLGNFFIIPVSIWPYLANESRNVPIKIMACSTGILSTLGLCLSYSRGSQLVGVVILGLTFLYFQKNRLRGLIKLSTLVPLVLIASYFLSALDIEFIKAIEHFHLSPKNNLETGLLSSKEEEFRKSAMTSSFNKRFGYWEDSLDFVKENPWIGSGPYSFIVLHHAYRDGYSHNAHNLMIQTTIDSGFIGLALLLTCLCTAIIKLYRKLTKESPQSSVRIIILGLILLGTQTHYLIEYFWHIPFFLTLFIFLVTMIGPGDIKVASRTKYLALHALLLVSLVGLGGFLTLKLNTYQNIIHNLLPKNGPDKDPVNLLETAKFHCPQCERPYLELSKHYLKQFNNSGDNSWAKKSTKELLMAEKTNHRTSKYYLAWGDLLMAQDKKTEAIGAYIKAVRKDPRNRALPRKIERLKLEEAK